MERNFKLYRKLFISTFIISMFTFGGGYVIVSLIKKKFVDEYKWIDDDEMLNILVIAQSSPGVIAVNTSIVVGYRIAGILGAFVTIIGTVLPPLIILTVVSYFYNVFRDNQTVRIVLMGMRAGVAAVLIDVVIQMLRKILDEKSIFAIVIMITSFIAAFVFQINVLFIILAGGICGLIIMHFSHGNQDNSSGVSEKSGKPAGGDE